jgi:hypothetical protein
MLFLTYMQDEAAVWARSQLKLLAEGEEVFSGCFIDCIEVFKLKFEPIQVNQEARTKLSKLTWGSWAIKWQDTIP